MLELYNDRLQDLFVSPAEAMSKRIEIKKDKKGLVFAQGAETKEATSTGELFALFEQGCANRRIAATSRWMLSSQLKFVVHWDIFALCFSGKGGTEWGTLKLEVSCRNFKLV